MLHALVSCCPRQPIDRCGREKLLECQSQGTMFLAFSFNAYNATILDACILTVVLITKYVRSALQCVTPGTQKMAISKSYQLLHNTKKALHDTTATKPTSNGQQTCTTQLAEHM